MGGKGGIDLETDPLFGMSHVTEAVGFDLATPTAASFVDHIGASS